MPARYVVQNSVQTMKIGVPMPIEKEMAAPVYLLVFEIKSQLGFTIIPVDFFVP